MEDFSFPKSSRLLRPGDYAGVFNDVRVRVPHRHFLILASPNNLGRPRLGLVFSKRNLKRAVQRNRVKRIVRETFRHRKDLGAMDIVVLGRRDLATQDNPTLHRILDQVWQTLAKKGARYHSEPVQPNQHMPQQSG
ncbi:ribonuclease P protein component [Marinobacter daqiaonensis]|uniref:Ribonuclease P protein component n=1 Tax=Marinobacter daqiaonensis TaxID=650891 RepID=A0A1I6IF87_9GAMM|nr:ribonuclease P protein component [Marinobacter daqiaonensis]SFR65331.1 ribonuclease P protein component [Marinobacter daqiaonensis]